MTITITEAKSDIETPYININFKGLKLTYLNVELITIDKKYKQIQILGIENVFEETKYLEELNLENDDDIKTIISKLKSLKMIKIEYV